VGEFQIKRKDAKFMQPWKQLSVLLKLTSRLGKCEKAIQSNVFLASFTHSLKSILVTLSANPKNKDICLHLLFVDPCWSNHLLLEFFTFIVGALWFHCEVTWVDFF